MEPSVTARLAESIASLDAERFPPEVVSKVRDCLLDSLGCMLGASRIGEARIAVDLVLGWGQQGDAAVPGLSGRYPAALAAYAAAQLANTLDYDDEFFGLGHPGATVIATALAVGQEQRASGKELIRAIVAGYEASIRIGRAMEASRQRQMTVRGHSWAVYAAVAATAALLRLDAPRIADAFGLAAQHALVPFVGKWYERPVPSVKNNYGWAAAGGVLAAYAAAAGAISNREVLDGDSGFWAMAGSDRWDPEIVLSGLGSDFAVMHVEFKAYACVWYMHWALDALEQILRSHPVDPSAVRSIAVRAAERLKVFGDYRPATLLHAQSSLPHAVASILLGKPLTTLNIGDPRVAELAERVRIEVDPGVDQSRIFSTMPSTVEIELADGRRLSARTEVAPGEPGRPLSRPQLRHKFFALAVPVVGISGADRLYRMIKELPEFPSAADLAGVFSNPSPYPDPLP